MDEKRIYLAGPEVFLPDPSVIADAKKAICKRHGLAGHFPLDAELARLGLSKSQIAYEISQSNERMMRECDAIIANMTPFRGPSADPGTAFEIGFMRALGKPVFGFSNDPRDFLRRTQEILPTNRASRRGETRIEDEFEMSVEDFGLADNLMLQGAIQATNGSFIAVSGVPIGDRYTDLRAFELCVQKAAAYFQHAGSTGHRKQQAGGAPSLVDAHR